MIYFIREVGDEGPIKIGYVADDHALDNRLSTLQVGNANELYIVATLRGSREDERAIQKHFAAHCVRGEWFAADAPGLRGLIFDAIHIEALEAVSGTDCLNRSRRVSEILNVGAVYGDGGNRTHAVFPADEGRAA